MIPSPIPSNEVERLADLRALKILDTPPEERFNRIVRLVSQAFHTPMAYIAMIDSDRQWFKAKCGLDVEQTDRKISFCSHTILQKEPLIIPDAKLDERFHDNPLVTGKPFIRFYAGFPLAGPHGHFIGTLCLASLEPRELKEDQIRMLREFAALAEHELNMIDLVYTQRELIEIKNKLATTQQRLSLELEQAAEYVRSLLPPKMEKPIQTDWRFISSSRLGGDGFGYHWLDEQHLAIYLLDVSGHGVGASLLSVSVLNALRKETLPHTDFYHPGSVLHSLNKAFPMSENDEKFITIWYGVYNLEKGLLHYSSAGHPPALILINGSPPIELTTSDFMIGIESDRVFDTLQHSVLPGSRFYLFSDGVLEIPISPDGQMLSLNGFVDIITRSVTGDLDEICKQIYSARQSSHFRDDFSLLGLVFP